MSRSKEDVAKAVETISSFVNSLSDEGKEFSGQMGCEHRTLQQSFTRLCVAWLVHLSKVQEGHYDLRNQGSVNLGRRFVEKMKDEDLYLPHV